MEDKKQTKVLEPHPEKACYACGKTNVPLIHDYYFYCKECDKNIRKSIKAYAEWLQNHGSAGLGER